MGVSTVAVQVNGEQSTLLIDSLVYESHTKYHSYPESHIIAHVHLLQEHLIPAVLAHLKDQDRSAHRATLTKIGVDQSVTFDVMDRSVQLKPRPELSEALKLAGTGKSSYNWLVHAQGVGLDSGGVMIPSHRDPGAFATVHADRFWFVHIMSNFIVQTKHLPLGEDESTTEVRNLTLNSMPGFSLVTWYDAPSRNSIVSVTNESDARFAMCLELRTQDGTEDKQVHADARIQLLNRLLVPKIANASDPATRDLGNIGPDANTNFDVIGHSSTFSWSQALEKAITTTQRNPLKPRLAPRRDDLNWSLTDASFVVKLEQGTQLTCEIAYALTPLGPDPDGPFQLAPDDNFRRLVTDLLPGLSVYSGIDPESKQSTLCACLPTDAAITTILSTIDAGEGTRGHLEAQLQVLKHLFTPMITGSMEASAAIVAQSVIDCLGVDSAVNTLLFGVEVDAEALTALGQEVAELSGEDSKDGDADVKTYQWSFGGNDRYDAMSGRVECKRTANDDD